MAFLELGISMRRTARMVGVTVRTVQKVKRRYEETGHYLRRPCNGRPRCTSAREDRYIISTVLRNRHQNAVEVQQQLLQTRRDYISDSTVRRRLAEANLKPRRPASGPKLERQHRVARLRYAREHMQWDEEAWSRILFADESRFSLYTSDGRRSVYRRPGERYLQACISERVQYGGGSVHVWAGIFSEGRTELVAIENGTLTGQRYAQEILNEYAGPYLANMRDGSMLMHDNARPHTAHIVQEYIQEVGISVMAWPSRSPDLNPIEHAWDELGRLVRNRRPPPTTLRALKQALVEEWENIPQHRLRNLVFSMPNLLAAVIRARGGFN
ncbi:transposable element Tc1 transposase [Leptidea sinapis]|uniref:transposable element Tc1 transposase n=1 Tax=Leptidea sinapis TaxID=189913 RepID=UPI0021C30D2A|nr:transposable element Tc1 transposase [Leptidea sinapis]